MSTRAWWLLASVIGAAGCFSAPSPLAPGIGGSVGVPHRGVLVDGSSLPQEGAGYRRLRDDGVRWGHPRLVAAIEGAAAEVQARRREGAPLIVADLSSRHGGRQPRHRSHQSGRDVDLLFYVLSPDGRSLEHPGFLHFASDGLAADGGRFFRLDLDRNWLLVKALARDERALVQWLFVARWIEALLMEYALALGEEDALLLKAAALMRQPSDSVSHDDHFHLRIACSPEDEVAGCEAGPPRWRWLPKPPGAPPLEDAELLAALLDDVAEER